MYGEAMVTIDEITVFGGRNEILVRGRQHRNHLNYASTWHINSHELNRLLNELQRVNSNLEVIEFFSTYTSTEGSIMQLSGNRLEQSTIHSGWLNTSPIVREIRA